MPLSEALFSFAQAALSGLPQDAMPDFDAAREALRQHRTLKAETLAMWPPKTRAGVAELIKTMLLIMELDRATGGSAPLVSSRLLSGTSATRLGEPLVAEILARSYDLEALHLKARRARQDSAR